MLGRGVNTTIHLIFLPTHTLLRIPITRTLHIRTIDRIRITAMDISIGRTHIITDIIHRILTGAHIGKKDRPIICDGYC
jgi:hypothetical protein